MNHLTLAALLLIASPAHAQPTQFQTPTQRLDGSALPVNEIAGFVIRYGDTSGVYKMPDIPFLNGATLPMTTLDVTVPDGDYFAVILTVDTDGRESMYSNEFSIISSKKFPPAPVVIPVGFSITIVESLP
jgi:hypothetical protein